MEQETKIRKKPLVCLRIVLNEYSACLDNCELAADMLQDLVRAGLNNVPCKYEVNQRMIDEAYEHISHKKEVIRKLNERRRLEKSGGK